MKHLILTLIATLSIVSIICGQCANAQLDTLIFINSDAVAGRSSDNTEDVYRICKGTESEFWKQPLYGGNWVFHSWVVKDGNTVVYTSTDDTLRLQNISAASVTIECYTTQNGQCKMNTVQFEVLETNLTANHFVNGNSIIFTDIPRYYSINLLSIPGGNVYSNGLLYQGSGLIFTVPSSQYQVRYQYQNHVWMQSPYCMDHTIIDTVNIGAVSVRAIQEDPSSRIYPNPTNDYFIIDGLDSEVQVSLFNSVGQQIQVINDFVPGNRINMYDLPSGMYIILLETTDGKLVRKQIIKQ